MLNRLGLICVAVFTGIILTGCNDMELAPSDFDAPPQESDSTITRTETVDIKKVIDGDTVDVVTRDGETERIRLLLIDTPESVHPSEPVQAYGQEASEFANSYLTAGEKVMLERGNPETDKYDRTLGYLWVDDVNFNQVMLEEGYARVAYVFEPNTRYINEFRQAESNAQQAKLNIWDVAYYVTDNGFDMTVMN